LYYFKKNLKKKKPFLVSFFRWVFGVFLGGFFIANPATWRMVSAALLAAAPLTRINSGCCPVPICLLEYDKVLLLPITSVVDRHRCDTDPNPNSV
jgi:hypothetical protein